MVIYLNLFTYTFSDKLIIMTIPAINWEISLKQVGGRESLAEELITLFVKELPQSQIAINQSYQDKHFQKLSDQLHKLDGGSSYAGVTRLKSAIGELSKAIKNNHQPDFDELMAKLNHEIDDVLLCAKEKSYRIAK